ncbi:DedA family [Senna tora]|uniref:DedA family n=1 Tax=Senna tora TaxID=362788 RepID=A0A834TR33_9FABA|nr:DedA family [Senna tora]
MVVLAHASMFNLYTSNHPKICFTKQLSRFPVGRIFLFANENKSVLVSRLFRNKTRSFKHDDRKNHEASTSKDMPERQDSIGSEVHLNDKEGHNKIGISFLAMIAIAMGIAVTATLISIYQRPILGSSFGLQILSESSSSSEVSQASIGFSFKAFGYKIILPEYAPGWIYFWLLMAAGCGLFISEEALNVWVGISLSRFLSLDGTWQSFAESFSRNASYVIATVFWVYWGVCISDLIPFYLGKLFRQSGASDDVSSRIGISKEKTLEITKAVQKYGNLIGFVERFSLGVRNPTAFLAGAMGISAELFFAGVCCGGLFTLPLQLGIGFLLRERPMFALATVATVVGIWTIFPYALAGSTALFFYLRRRYSS